MRIGWDNLVDDATITSDNEDANYTLNVLQDIHLSNTFRFADLTGGYIDFDLGSAEDVSVFGFIGNVSLTGTITLKGNSTESWASPPVEETITIANRPLWHYFTSSNYRYWRIEITDASNPDGYIEVERIFLGTYDDYPSPSPDYTYDREDLSTRQFSPTGQPFTVVRPQRAVMSLSFPPVITNTTRESFLEMFESVGVGVPVWVDLWEDDFSTEEPLYALIQSGSVGFTKFQKGTRWSLDISFVESR